MKEDTINYIKFIFVFLSLEDHHMKSQKILLLK